MPMPAAAARFTVAMMTTVRIKVCVKIDYEVKENDFDRQCIRRAGN